MNSLPQVSVVDRVGVGRGIFCGSEFIRDGRAIRQGPLGGFRLALPYISRG